MEENFSVESSKKYSTRLTDIINEFELSIVSAPEDMADRVIYVRDGQVRENRMNSVKTAAADLQL